MMQGGTFYEVPAQTPAKKKRQNIKFCLFKLQPDDQSGKDPFAPKIVSAEL